LPAAVVQGGVDHAERYYQLTLLGREAFVNSVAPAALVRDRGMRNYKPLENTSRDLRNTYAEDTLLARLDTGLITGEHESGQFEVYPLAKKAGAPFADMITVGRTANNDVVLRDITVSRFHAFFRSRPGGWFVCDAGSKNGTFLHDTQLKPRKENRLSSGDEIRLGDIATRFYTAEDLFDVLSTR
jgi:hypothetical protein